MTEEITLSKAQRYAAMKKRFAECSESTSSGDLSAPSMPLHVDRTPKFPYRQVVMSGSMQIVSKRPTRQDYQPMEQTHVMVVQDGTSGLVILAPSEADRTALLDSYCAFIGALALINKVPINPVGLLSDGVIYRVVVSLSNQYSLLYLISNGSADLLSSLTSSGISLACDSFTKQKSYLHVSRVCVSGVAAEEPAPVELMQLISSFPGQIGIVSDREALAGPDCWSLFSPDYGSLPEAWAAWRRQAGLGKLEAEFGREIVELPKGLEKTLERVMMEARDTQLPGAQLTPPLVSALNGIGPWRNFALVRLPIPSSARRIIKISERRVKMRNDVEELFEAINRVLKNP